MIVEYSWVKKNQTEKPIRLNTINSKLSEVNACEKERERERERDLHTTKLYFA
jgi:hypothetical protein